jgi:hypothetical protein
MTRASSSKFLTLGAIALSLALTGCLTDDDDGGNGGNGDPVTTRSVEVGAQDNASIGSSLDIDTFEAYLAAQARPKSGDIDLIFGNSSATLIGLAVYSPDVAKSGINGSDGFGYMSDWNPVNTTTIKSVDGVVISNITTTDQVDSLWDAGTVVANGRLPIAAGDTFLARSNLNKVVLIRVTTVTPGDNGKASFSGIAKF